MKDVVMHYDALIDEGNDPVCDPLPLREHMDGWDGKRFLESLHLKDDLSVLEIGVGTGRLALRTAPLCGEFLGIDVSPKTVERARAHLHMYSQAKAVCGDFMTYDLEGRTFDLIYSSLTFMHIRDKARAIQRVYDLLALGGRFVLSIDKNQANKIDMGNRSIDIYPDTPAHIRDCLLQANFFVQAQYETEFAVIFEAVKRCKSKEMCENEKIHPCT